MSQTNYPNQQNNGAAAIPVYDASGSNIIPAYFQGTVTATAQALATIIGTTIPAGAKFVYVTPETGNVRYRMDGTAPTATVGQPVQQAQSWPITNFQGSAILWSQLEFISASTVTVSFEFRG